MRSLTYQERRGQIETYFDRTASEAWARLTSNDRVSRIRETVRAGRDQMRAQLLEWLPEELTGRRVLDAGCGTGALAIELARRGAEVVAIDLSPSLVGLGRERAAEAGASIDFRVGDMLDPSLGEFDHAVAMDSIIHYRATDMVDIVARLAARTRGRVLFTFAPRTPLLTLMHVVGRLFPRSNRAPAIEPIGVRALRGRLSEHPELATWIQGRQVQVKSGFYISRAQELVRP